MHDNRSQPPFKRLLFRKICIGVVAECFAGCVMLLVASADASELLPKYSEHQNLTYYLNAAGGKIPVKTTADWEKRRAHILAHMQSVMGPLPKPSKAVPLKVEVLEEVAVGSLTRQLISYHTDSFDRRVSAYLFLPKKSKTKVAAVLCLHQTTRIGKREPAGLGGKPNLHYALHLAKRGYVTLAPDYPSFGDYKYDFTPMQGYLYKSGTMKAIYDNVRAVDVLQSLKNVDPERIGCIGHSLGGHNTMFTAAFEPRIKVMVSNCGFTRFHKYKNGRLKGWTSTRYMPLINTQYNNDPDQVPFDFTEIVASFAPRPFLASSPLRDSNFEVSGVRDVIAAAKPIYRLYGKPENLAANYPDCPHDFPPDARQVAYRFLDKHLRHKPAVTSGGEEAAGTEKGGVPIRPTSVRELGTSHLSFDEPALAVAVNSKSKIVVSLLDDRVDGRPLHVTSIDVKPSGSKIATTFASRVSALALLPDGKRLAVTDGKSIQWVRFPSGDEIHTFKMRKPKHGPRLSLSQSGHLLACWSSVQAGSTVEVCELGTRRVIRTYGPVEGKIYGCGFVELPTETLCVIAADELHVYKITAPVGGPHYVHSLRPSHLAAVSPSHQQLCLATKPDQGAVSLVRYDFKADHWSELAQRRWISDVAYSPDGIRIAAISDRGLETWLASSGKAEPRIELECSDPFFRCRLRFDETGKVVAVWGRDHRVRLFDLVRRKVWLNPAGHSQPVNAIKWASADKTLVSGAEKVRMWQMPEGRQMAVLHASKKPMTRVDGLDVSDDGRFVVASTYEASRDLFDRMAFVTLYDVAKRKAIYRKRQNGWPVFGASFSENDQTIAYVCFASPDNLDVAPGFVDGLRLRTVANRKLQRSIAVKWPIYVTFAVGGNIIAIDGFVDEDDKGSELLIFDLRNGHNIGRVQNPNARVTALSVTEDGKRVLIGYGDGTVEFRDAPKFARAIKIHAHDGAVQSVVADTRRRLVATIGRKNGVLRLWDDSTGERRGEIRPQSKIVSTAFAHRHDQIACGHRNGLITIWQFASRSADSNE